MRNRTLLAWFSAGHFANDCAVSSLWLIVPAVGIAMELSPADVGLLFTLVNIGGALAFLPAGLLTDHVANRGRLLLATFWWVGVGYLLAAMAPEYWSLALLLAIAAMGDAAWHPIATGVLAREHASRRAQVLGIHAIGGSLAEVLSPLAVGFVIAVIDWRGAMALAGVPALLMGVAFLAVVRHVPRVPAKRVSRTDLLSLLHAWRTTNAMRMVAMICFYNLALMALLSMIPLYLAERHGFGFETAGIAFATMLVVGAVVQPWVGKLSDRIGRRPVVAVGNFAAAAAAGLMVLEPTVAVAIGLLIVAVATLAGIRAAVLASAVDHTGHSEGTTLGLAFMLLDGVGALGAVLAGLAANLSWSHTFALAAGFSLLAAAFASLTAFTRRADERPPALAVSGE